MKRLAVKLLPALLLPGLLAACLLPPFDRGLSLAQATARKLKLEARIGPLYHWRGELERGRSFFLPSKILGLNRGFLLVFGAFDGRLFYVTYDTAGEYFITGDYVFPVMNSNENAFNYGAYVLKDTSGTDDDALLLVRPNLAADQRMEYSCNSGTITIQQYDFTESPAWVASGTAAVGVGMYPNSLSTAFDFLTLLVYNEGSFKYYERISNFGFSSPTYAPSWTDSGEFDLPGSPAQAFYFRNQVSNLRFLSAWNGAQFVNYRWDDALTPIPLPFSGRIEALLSTDELFVVDGERAVVYSPSGARKYRFPLGDLHFAYETYIGGVPTLLFSLIYWDQVSGDDEEFHINVYSLPTARLSTLD